MEDGFNRAISEPPLSHLVEKNLFIEVVGDVRLGDIDEFSAVGEVVDNNDIGPPTLINLKTAVTH